MSLFGPIPSTRAAPLAVTGYRIGPTPPSCGPEAYSDPPEMPESVKTQSLKGLPCLYGFKFTDDAAISYLGRHSIELPVGRDDRSWVLQRKRAIMRTHARELGLMYAARIIMLSVYETGVSGACREDVVYFSIQEKGDRVPSRCLKAEKIKQLMEAMGVEGEPYWIVA
ncbi:hypothetical protein AURDEDRAFT_109518 [Auricularia subglabra TFB-10046 SS5]|nr:hypothetical protein AURDEDRAFT_109518 [Auricularia subglabra TFB-10046 SS5]